MNHLWKITLSEYLEICEIAKNDGVKAGESIEPYFLAYMKLKGQKPEGATELNREEWIREYVSHGNSILEVNGKDMKIHRPEEKNDR